MNQLLGTVKFIAKVLLVILTIVYIIYISYMYLNQEKLVFHAEKLPSNHQFNFQNQFKEFQISSFDKCRLNALLFKTNKSKGVILYLHGNAGNLQGWAQSSSLFTDNGYDVFMLDYRGFGKSEGQIENQQQLYKDLKVIYQFLLTHYSEDKITVMGYSIGSGLASYLASTHNPNRLILQAPYYNFSDLTFKIVPFYPNFLKKFTIPTNKYFKKIKCQIVIFHGKDDNLIPVSNSYQLKALFKPSDKLYVLENQQHNGMNDNVEFSKILNSVLN